MPDQSIIVGGYIETRPGHRDTALAKAREIVLQARRTAGCLEFVVAADPIEKDRLVTFERWESEEALAAFRDGGPDDDQAVDFAAIHVHDYMATRR